MSDEVELYDVIRKVRGDLARAMWEGEGKDLRFRLESVELELEIAVMKVARGAAKVKLVVVDADAGKERATTTRHHVKVVLSPRLMGEVEESPWVSGPAVDSEE
ncbi:trypco2 family protein [Micromonospora sp. NPDC047644]|uniref:trypco2 family protein n=1 Tax=Micromonospora sp. NPDC047644 TaxID=3157203 RepID=UPI0034536B5D